MNNLSKSFVNEEGEKETLVASSDDNYQVKLGNYTISNHQTKKESRLARKFKGTIFGSDIGIRSKGFSNIAILAIVIALAVLALLYFSWRF